MAFRSFDRKLPCMADLLVNGHIELKTHNDIMLGTSKYELSWLVGHLALDFGTTDNLSKFSSLSLDR